jgi:5-(carboxyamino)imidazole ribonucleotide synthase
MLGFYVLSILSLGNGDIVVNEIAPRPHNSGHHTLDSCFTSQFEQQVRTLAKLPLGNTELLKPVVMLNLFGDIRFDKNQSIVEPEWDGKFFVMPNAKFSLCMAKENLSLDQKNGTCGFSSPDSRLGHGGCH